MADAEILSSFAKIVWVSVGQEPDIRELQESIFVQLTDSAVPDSANTPALVMAAEEACLGKAGCSVDARAASTADPCPGVAKTAALVVECVRT